MQLISSITGEASDSTQASLAPDAPAVYPGAQVTIKIAAAVSTLHEN